MYVSFAKYHGLGNDFILIDDRQESFPMGDDALIAHLCNRRIGIGADGLILLQNSFKADYVMRYFNADGKEAEMCGNGLRCFVAFLKDQGLSSNENCIWVSGQIYRCAFVDKLISVQMGRAKETSWNIILSISGKEVCVHYVHIGVPHAVIFVENVDTISVKEEGREIRWHPIFQPKGVNANFVSELPSGMLKLRTFERGVEQETLACGTGAVATAIAASKMRGYRSPVKIVTALNEIIEIRLSDEGEVEMIGGATFVFKGRIAVKDQSCITV